MQVLSRISNYVPLCGLPLAIGSPAALPALGSKPGASRSGSVDRMESWLVLAF